MVRLASYLVLDQDDEVDPEENASASVADAI